MDASHINTGPKPSAAGNTGASLPAPGTVIMASVEEDLGEGKYSLRWSGRHITVSSQTALTRGQSLILKSEASAEGRTRLVVQGPALPEVAHVTGRVIYRPGVSHGGGRGITAGPHPDMGDKAGAPISAGLGKAITNASLASVKSMLGAVLEPLEDFEERALQLFRAAREEKEAAGENHEKAAKQQQEDNGPVDHEGGGGPAPKGTPARREHPFSAQNPVTPDQTPKVQKVPANHENPAGPVGVSDVHLSTRGNNVPEAGAGAATVDVGPPIREVLSGAALMAEQPVPDRGDGGAPMPDAIVDKAATLLLRAAGIELEPSAVDAARALVRHNAPVDRQTVTAMVEMAAGAEEGDREQVLRAGARLAAKDIPLAEPLVAGMAAALERRGGAHALLRRAEEALTMETALPDADKLSAEARRLLQLLRVDLDRPDAADVLERFASALGRETLGKALALVETAAQAVLENDAFLQKADAALGELLRLLGKEIADANRTGGNSDFPPAAEPDAAAPPPAPPEVPALPGTAEIPVTPTPLPAGGGLPINAYLNAPKAVSVEALLSRLPPMPQLARLDMPVPQTRSPMPPQTEIAENPPPEAFIEQTTPSAEAALRQGGMERGLSRQFPNEALFFQTPGLNRPELDLLRPSGLLQRYLEEGFDAAGGLASRDDAGVLLRKLLSETPEHVREALRGLPGEKPAVLREVAARISRMEAEALRDNPVLNRLADAAGSLRDLGRQMLAAKAENIAGTERDPGVMLAEIPFRLGDQGGDGRMQMFYRRARKQTGGWNSRVILDLNTTRMGPLLGDLRFFAQEATVNIFVEREDAVAHLERSRAELVDALAEKGFRVKTRFMVIPQTASRSSGTSAKADESGDVLVRESRHGRLDVQG